MYPLTLNINAKSSDGAFFMQNAFYPTSISPNLLDYVKLCY